MIERKKKRTARIGIFAVAHATYWEQFEGLEDNIMGYHKDFFSLVEDYFLHPFFLVIRGFLKFCSFCFLNLFLTKFSISKNGYRF